MTPSIPITTDNIYKFAALFGLVLVISTGFGMLYLLSINYEFAVKNFDEYELLMAKENLSQAEFIRKNAFDMQIKYRTLAVNGFMFFLTLLAVIGSIVSFWGSYHWLKKVQPKQDELINLQIEKTRREVQMLDKQLEKSE
jgi:hypothetical protein